MISSGRKAYFTASVISQAVALMRYVLLARLLGPVELGFAAMLILTASFLESVSDTGSDRFLIQDPAGDSDSMLSLVHLVMAGRGFLIALALALFAVPLAGVYHSPQLVTSLIVLGLAPLVGGFVHLDVRRLQRHGNFWPESLMTIISETVGLAGTVGAAWLTRDHTAVIYGLTARSAAMVIVSHIMAEKRYRWAFARSEGARFSRFAAPLFLNGFLLFVGSQGDRLIVANRVGPAALGHYSAVLLLILYPASALQRFIAGTHLPQIAAARSDPARLDQAGQRLAGRTLMLAIAMAAGFALVGPIATPILYGHRFAQGPLIFAMLGAVQSARFLRVWPTTLAIAMGRTFILTANNLARQLAFPVALVATLYYPSLASIVLGFLVGEVIAIMVALALLARDPAIKPGPEARRVRDFILVALALIAAGWSAENGRAVWTIVSAAAAASAIALAGWSEREVLAEAWRWSRNALARYATRLHMHRKSDVDPATGPPG
jgi:O-antigen/teichoic acid export membrane protein